MPRPKTGKNAVVAPATQQITLTIPADGATPPSTTPGTAPVIPPELMPVFQAALNALPPDAVKKLLISGWKYVVGLLIPLVFVTWNTLVQIWNSPATSKEIKAAQEADHRLIEETHKTLEEFDARLKKMEGKFDQVVWWIQQGQRPPIPNQPYPTSGPASPYYPSSGPSPIP